MHKLLLVVGMSVGYGIFAVGCLILMLVSVVYKLRYTSAAVRVTRLRNMLARLLRIFQAYVQTLGLIHVCAHNLQPVNSGLLVANHPSLIDVLWILAAMPQVCCVLKSDVERNWLLQPLARDLGYLSNADPERLLEEGAARLAAGEVLLVFPEATRTLPGELPRFRLGAAELLVRAGAVAHPLVIRKTDSYLSKAAPWYRFPDQPLHYELSLHPPQGPWQQTPARTQRRLINAELEAFFHAQLAETLASRTAAAQD